MATKKASPVKITRSSDSKIAVKKVTKKSAASPVKKVSASKKAPAKKAAAPVKKALTSTKKVIAPVKKALAKKATSKKVVAEKPNASPKKEIKSKKTADEILVDAVVAGILEVKGKNISILDLRGINNRVCDYYIICQADSSTQVNAIAGSVEVMVKKLTGERPYHSEGFQNSEWILVDYVTVVVHVFQSQVRDFYNLESLWADAEITNIAFE
jgi:ribosome-associated protein